MERILRALERYLLRFQQIRIRETAAAVAAVVGHSVPVPVEAGAIVVVAAAAESAAVQVLEAAEKENAVGGVLPVEDDKEKPEACWDGRCCLLVWRRSGSWRTWPG